MSALEALNRYRAQAGLTPLGDDASLRNLAEARALEVAHDYGHAPGLPASEVLTVGALDEAEAVWEWMGWPAHRAILMDARATRAGFGQYEQNGQTYWVGLIA